MIEVIRGCGRPTVAHHVEQIAIFHAAPTPDHRLIRRAPEIRVMHAVRVTQLVSDDAEVKLAVEPKPVPANVGEAAIGDLRETDFPKRRENHRDAIVVFEIVTASRRQILRLLVQRVVQFVDSIVSRGLRHGENRRHIRRPQAHRSFAIGVLLIKGVDLGDDFRGGQRIHFFTASNGLTAAIGKIHANQQQPFRSMSPLQRRKLGVFGFGIHRDRRVAQREHRLGRPRCALNLREVFRNLRHLLRRSGDDNGVAILQSSDFLHVERRRPTRQRQCRRLLRHRDNSSDFGCAVPNHRNDGRHFGRWNGLRFDNDGGD